MLIKMPLPGTGFLVEFDTDKIIDVEMPREVAEVSCAEAGCPDCDTVHRELPGPNALILRFATLDDAPKWVGP